MDVKKNTFSYIHASSRRLYAMFLVCLWNCSIFKYSNKWVRHISATRLLGSLIWCNVQAEIAKLEEQLNRLQDQVNTISFIIIIIIIPIVPLAEWFLNVSSTVASCSCGMEALRNSCGKTLLIQLTKLLTMIMSGKVKLILLTINVGKKLKRLCFMHGTHM